MPNSIADPLVEGVDSDAVSERVRIEATPSGAATVWINRPEQHNAIDSLTVAALHEAFETLKGAEGVRIVFIRGAGGQFGDGADLDWLRLSADLSEDDLREDATTLAHALKALAELPTPTVALIEGAAIGAVAAGLIAACDTAVATADARFGFPEVRRGLVPAVAAPYIVEAVGARNARRVFALGETLDAVQAQGIGLVHQVVADAGALEAVQSGLSRDSLAAAPGAVAESKAIVRRVAGTRVDRDLLEDTVRAAARARTSDEGREGVTALIEGRAPSWTQI